MNDSSRVLVWLAREGMGPGDGNCARGWREFQVGGASFSIIAVRFESRKDWRMRVAAT